MNEKCNNTTIKNELPKRELGVKIEDSKTPRFQKKNDNSAAIRKKRLESMTDEEIIEENLKQILEKKSQEEREERKANGRLIAVVVAFLVIFLAIYHAWIRKTAVLAGVLVPAAIMLGYGCWVVVLARRYKRKRANFEKHVEEVALKNKVELEKKAIANKSKSEKKALTTKTTATSTTVHFENEISKKQEKQRSNDGAIESDNAQQTVTVQIEDHRKQRKRRDNRMTSNAQTMKDGHIRRPSIRQKLFRQTIPRENPDIHAKLLDANEVLVHEKRKKLQRMDTLPLPQIIRMGSAP